MDQLNVLITGIGGGGVGEQIIKALRLSEYKYTLVGCDSSVYSKGFYDVDFFYQVPAANHSDYIVTLLHICKKHHIIAIFPGSEPELKVLSINREKINEMGILLPINPHHVIDICLDKSKTMQFLAESGFHYPKTITVKKPDDLALIDFFPAVLKPSIGGGGSANIFIAQSSEEIKVFGLHLLSYYPEFIIQEYIGNPESEFTVGVLHSMDGIYINSIAVKRNILLGLSNRIKLPNKSGNIKFGKILAISSGITQGEIGPFPEVSQECERIANKLGCTSTINIQCRIQDDKVYVFEINPRYSGTTCMRAMVGYNEPDLMIRKHVLNEQIVSRFKYKRGILLRGLTEAFFENANLETN